MSKSFVRQLLAAALAAIPWTAAFATGNYFSPSWLAKGGEAVEHSPEFYWAMEVRKLATEFQPKEKRVTKIGAATSLPDQAAEAELQDLRDAVQKGRLKADNAAQLIGRYEAARQVIAAANETTAGSLPALPPSEFADYQRGAFAFHRGEAHYEEARSAWEGLLQRPKEKRHYRSVWAAFMLGKLAVHQRNAKAAEWFQMTRRLAEEGFADTLGLAADSYGWEAKSELEQGHPEKAASLYLTQLATGDASAIVSLKALVPDREPIYGTLSFAPLPPENADAATLKKFEEQQAQAKAARLEHAARDPLLRRLTSAHILATESVMTSWFYQDDSAQLQTSSRCTRWLETIEKAGIEQVDNADQLGWIAYTAGRYAEAERWLKRIPANSESATALWLKAKLLRRAGKSKEATALMAQVVKSLQTDAVPDTMPEPDDNFEFYSEAPAFADSAKGDLATLRLSSGDLLGAFGDFDDAGLSDDAAFLADHVLTADELKTYVDAHAPWSAEDEAEAAKAEESGSYLLHKGQHLRSLLARHLVRDQRYAEARAYFAPEERKSLDRYTAALDKATNEKLAKEVRARSWFDAALIAYQDGRTLLSTGEPSHLNADQPVPPSDLASERRTGATLVEDHTGEKTIYRKKPIQLHVTVGPLEKKRLLQSQPPPNQQHHYRYTAAAHAWKAAQLLPDDTPELADVLNTAGRWIQNDERAADKFFQAIERRAHNTPLGKAAGARHWFVDMKGPWSGADAAGGASER